MLNPNFIDVTSHVYVDKKCCFYNSLSFLVN